MAWLLGCPGPSMGDGGGFWQMDCAPPVSTGDFDFLPLGSLNDSNGRGLRIRYAVAMPEPSWKARKRAWALGLETENEDDLLRSRKAMDNSEVGRPPPHVPPLANPGISIGELPSNDPTGRDRVKQLQNLLGEGITERFGKKHPNEAPWLSRGTSYQPEEGQVPSCVLPPVV